MMMGSLATIGDVTPHSRRQFQTIMRINVMLRRILEVLEVSKSD
jgi:hypothetical protein